MASCFLKHKKSPDLHLLNMRLIKNDIHVCRQGFLRAFLTGAQRALTMLLPCLLPGGQSFDASCDNLRMAHHIMQVHGINVALSLHRR